MKQTEEAKAATRKAFEAWTAAWASGPNGWKYMFVWKKKDRLCVSFSRDYCFGDGYEPQYENEEYQFSRKWLEENI